MFDDGHDLEGGRYESPITRGGAGSGLRIKKGGVHCSLLMKYLVTLSVLIVLPGDIVCPKMILQSAELMGWGLNDSLAKPSKD